MFKRILAAGIACMMIAQLIVLPVQAKTVATTMNLSDIDISAGDVLVKDLKANGTWKTVGTNFSTATPGFYSPGGTDYTLQNASITNMDGLPALRLSSGVSATTDTVIRKVNGVDADDSYINQSRNATTYISFKQKFSADNVSGGYMRLAFDQSTSTDYTLFAGAAWSTNKYVLQLSVNNSATTTTTEIKKGVVYNYLIKIRTYASGSNDEIYVNAWPEGTAEPLTWAGTANGGKLNACPYISFKSSGLKEPEWADLKYEVYSDSGSPATSATDVNNTETAVLAANTDGSKLAAAETAVAAIPSSSVAYQSFLNRLIQIRAKNSITKAVTDLQMDTSDYSTEMGFPFRLNAKIAPIDATNQKITYSSDNAAVATVDELGVVRFISSGSANITAVTQDGSITKSRKVTFDKTSVTGIEISDTAKSISTFETAYLNANALPADASDKRITWMSSDPTIASVDNSGKLSGLKPGTVTLTAKTTDGGFTATCAVTVNYVAPQTITFDKTSAVIATGKTLDIVATVGPAYTSDKSIVWTSSDQTVATVSAAGRVTAVKGGNTVIRAVTTDGGLIAECAISVIVDLTSIAFQQGTSKSDFTVGDVYQLTPVFTPPEALPYLNVVWETGKPGYVTVSNTGLVSLRGVAANVEVRCKVTNALGTKTAKFNVTAALPTVNYPASGEVQNNIAVTAESNADGTPSWQSASLTGTTTAGTYILTNTDVGAGYSFLWTPATQTLAQDPSSTAPVSVVIPSAVAGVNVLVVGSNVVVKPTPLTLQSVVISDGIIELGTDAFQSQKILTSVKMPATLIKLGDGAFRVCTMLKTVEIPEGVTTIGYQIFKSSGVTDIVFPSTIGSAIPGDLFSSCSSLKSVTFKGYVKSMTWGVFNGTGGSLETITFMNPTAMTGVDASTFPTGQSFHFTVLYPKNGTGYDTAAFQALFPATTVFKTIGHTNAEILSATLDDGVCNIQYNIDIDEDDRAAGAIVLFALYNNNALVETNIRVYDSTEWIFTPDGPIDSVKAYVWSSIDTLRPLCDAAFARVVPAAPRQRVMNQNGTVVASNGELLRGAFAGCDYGEAPISYSQLAAIKENGCNTLHLYAERPGANLPAGTNVQTVDQYVAMTEELGLYLILTSGDSTLNEQFSMDFWSFYGERYKNKTHVIFELQNESNGFSPPTEAYLASLNRVYHHLRDIAPDTHILLFSFSHLRSVENIDHYIEAMGIDDWSKTAIAWHGYDSDPFMYAAFFNDLKSKGYSSINTELPATNNSRANPVLLRSMEDLGCSWNHFVSASNITNDAYWKTPIETSGVKWKSEYGTWPDMQQRSAFCDIPAVNLNGSRYVTVNTSGQYITKITNGSYLMYSKINFVTGPAIFDAYAASEHSGTIELRLDRPDGTLIGTCNVTGNGSIDNWERYSTIISSVTGVHDLYLVFTGDGDDLLNLKKFVFTQTPLNPYVRMEAENYSSQHGVDMGSSGDTGGGMCLTAIQENDYTAYDNVDFGTGAARFEIRIASVLTTCDVELRLDSLDGPVIGTCSLPITGGWTTWQTLGCNISGAAGRHTLYVIFKNGHHGGGFCNVNWFQFYQ